MAAPTTGTGPWASTRPCQQGPRLCSNARSGIQPRAGAAGSSSSSSSSYCSGGSHAATGAGSGPHREASRATSHKAPGCAPARVDGATKWPGPWAAPLTAPGQACAAWPGGPVHAYIAAAYAWSCRTQWAAPSAAPCRQWLHSAAGRLTEIGSRLAGMRRSSTTTALEQVCWQRCLLAKPSS